MKIPTVNEYGAFHYHKLGFEFPKYIFIQTK